MNINDLEAGAFGNFTKILVSRHHESLKNAVANNNKGLGIFLERILKTF